MTDSDDETKYTVKSNKNFFKMKRAQKEAHVLLLWRTCFNKAFVCAQLISQYHSITTKFTFFGRQMLSYDNIKEK